MQFIFLNTSRNSNVHNPGGRLCVHLSPHSLSCVILGKEWYFISFILILSASEDLNCVQQAALEPVVRFCFKIDLTFHSHVKLAPKSFLFFILCLPLEILWNNVVFPKAAFQFFLSVSCLTAVNLIKVSHKSSLYFLTPRCVFFKLNLFETCYHKINMIQTYK